MNLSAPFVARPVATTLLAIGVVLAGAVAFTQLPVSPLPQVDYPTISVQAQLPGASPETMASTVATPLERSLGRIAGVTEITSSSSLGSSRITLQFDLSRDINDAATEVQSANNAARSQLPSGMPNNPTYRKVNPADAPIMVMTLTSDSMTRGQMYDWASTVVAQKLSQVRGVGHVTVGGSALPAVRAELNPTALNAYGISFNDVRTSLAAASAVRTSSTPMPYLLSAGGFSSTRTAGSELPPTVTWPTPSICESFWARIVDAASYICPCVIVSDVSARIMIGASAGLTLRQLGLLGRFAGN